MWIKYIIRFVLTVFVGILATAFNLKAAANATAPSFATVLKGQIDVINSLFALITASITIVYIYYQIKKIRKELKND